LPVPSERIVDTSGAGDVFHGAYIYSYLADPTLRWADHFEFAKAAAAFKIQHLGNEAGLPSLEDIAAVACEFGAQKVRPMRARNLRQVALKRRSKNARPASPFEAPPAQGRGRTSG
jgi:hypothetical protein